MSISCACEIIPKGPIGIKYKYRKFDHFNGYNDGNICRALQMLCYCGNLKMVVFHKVINLKYILSAQGRVDTHSITTVNS